MANTHFQLDALLPRHTRKLMQLRGERYAAEANGEGCSSSIHLSLDKNENAFGSTGTEQAQFRYPDACCGELRRELANAHQADGIQAANICVGAGVSELLDVVMRAFIQPDKDNVIITTPYEGLWRECAVLNGAMVQEIALNSFFQLPANKLKKEIGEQTKLIFLSHPNAIIGTPLRPFDVIDLLDNFAGVVVVDESYIDFCSEQSLLPFVKDYPNLVVLRTFSKAYGLAGLRVGVAYAQPAIAHILRTLKTPYSVGTPAQQGALKALNLPDYKDRMVRQIQAERDRLTVELQRLPFVKSVLPSQANFLLLYVEDAKKTHGYLLAEHVQTLLCAASTTHLEQGGIRISIGNTAENDRLLALLRDMPARLSPVRRFFRTIASAVGKVGMLAGIVKKLFG